MTEPLAPTPTGPLTARIADTLRQKITSGELAPGERLSEHALSVHLGISRNTLREVFRVLTHDGLLQHQANRGVFVAAPSATEVMDLFRVRHLLEPAALAGAYPGHPALMALRLACQDALRARDAGDWRSVGTANMAFHRAVVELADSPRLNQWFARLLAELRLVFGQLHDAQVLHAPFVEMNQHILQLAEAGQFNPAAEALKRYLEQSERVVLAALARQAAGGEMEVR
jgi:DNA-binding GntR family transcriptional regulator